MEANKMEIQKPSTNGLIILPKELAQVIETGEIFKIQNNLTPIKSFECRKLSSFIKEYPEQVYSSIETMIAKLAMSVNVRFNIEPHQAPDIARAIYKKYYFYSIEEIALVFRMISEGELQKIYDRLSKEIILEAFISYENRFRDSIVQNLRDRQNKSFENENLEVHSLLGGNEGIKKLLDAWSEKDKEEQEKESNFKAWKEKYFKGDIDLKK